MFIFVENLENVRALGASPQTYLLPDSGGWLLWLQIPVHSRRRSNVFGDSRFWFFPKIWPNIITFTRISIQFCSKFALIFPKSNQICPNLTNFAQTILLGDAAACPAFPAPTALPPYDILLKFYCPKQFFVNSAICKMPPEKTAPLRS